MASYPGRLGYGGHGGLAVPRFLAIGTARWCKGDERNRQTVARMDSP